MTTHSNILADNRAHTALLNGYMLQSPVVAALGRLLFGFDTAVMSDRTRSPTETFSLSLALPDTAASSALRSSAAGAFGEEIEHRV